MFRSRRSVNVLKLLQVQPAWSWGRRHGKKTTGVIFIDFFFIVTVIKAPESIKHWNQNIPKSVMHLMYCFQLAICLNTYNIAIEIHYKVTSSQPFGTVDTFCFTYTIFSEWNKDFSYISHFQQTAVVQLTRPLYQLFIYQTTKQLWSDCFKWGFCSEMSFWIRDLFSFAVPRRMCSRWSSPRCPTSPWSRRPRARCRPRRWWARARAAARAARTPPAQARIRRRNGPPDWPSCRNRWVTERWVSPLRTKIQTKGGETGRGHTHSPLTFTTYLIWLNHF